MGAASDRIAARINGAIETACKALVLEIDRELRKRGTGTPVDTGHARANWIPSVGQPHRGEVPGTSSAAHDQGVAQVLAFKLGSGMLFLSNSVPYVRRLNDGWSKQAPAFFVEACVDRAITTIERKMGVSFAALRSEVRRSVGAEGAENMAAAYSPFGDD